MKQTKKQLFFSDFEPKLFPKKVCKNELEPSEILNLNLCNGNIVSCGGFSPLLQELFGEDFERFCSLNSSVIDKLVYVFLYDYFDETENLTVTRYFFFDLNLDAEHLKS